MITTGLCYSDRFIDHETGLDHPERPARLRAIRERLETSGLVDKLVELPFSPVDMAQVKPVHSPSYVERFQKLCYTGGLTLDSAECPINGETFEIARLAAGAGVAAVDAVMAGTVKRAFCPVRPPGHHAERDKAMGFCYFNNIAIAAERLVLDHGVERLAILDFDVHHGNGTQHHFDLDPNVMFVSIHQSPETLFPGTGYASEIGLGPAKGTTLNVPMPPGSGPSAYRTVFDDLIIPKLDGFKPQFLLISSGFDAHRCDPLSQINLDTDDFTWMTEQAVQIANTHAQGRVVSFLEGGYHLKSLADGVQAHVEALIAD